MFLRPLTILALAAAADAADPAASPWSWDLKLGAFLQNVASHNAADSRDTAIAGATDSVAYKFTGDGMLLWKGERHRFEQRLNTEYGRIRNQGQDWAKNADYIRYVATAERSLGAPHFLYLNGQAETSFKGPPPDEHPATPLVGKLSAGYGQRFEGLLPLSDALTWRLGAYVRKRWERGGTPAATEVETGPEQYLRYERRQSDDVSYYLQQETTGEATDLRHVVESVEAGISARVARALVMQMRFRAYFEARPSEAADDVPGYDQWSLREEAMIGLLWTAASAR
jgi:hypothetical protein